LVRHLALTSASFSETRLLEEMLLGDEAAVFADGAYAQEARKAALRRRGGYFAASSIGPGAIGR
jgi:IS5 family transposase